MEKYLYGLKENKKRSISTMKQLIAEYAFDHDLAQVPRPENIYQCIKEEAYQPEYKSYV